MEPNVEQKLGTKALIFFVFRRVLAPFVLLLIGLLTLVLKNFALIYLAALPNGAQGPLISDTIVSLFGVGGGLTLLSFVFLIFAALIGWLEYDNYRFTLDEFALKIRRGILSKEEIAIPYRNIQNVDIARSILYQLFGISKVSILTAGHDDPQSKDEAEGVLDILDAGEAEMIREALLKQATVQLVSDVDRQPVNGKQGV